jgi:NitT/TauT family transport system permease protein
MTLLRRGLPPLVAGVLIVLLWELAISVFDIEDFLLPRPTAIFEALGDNWDVIEQAARNTFSNAVRGLLLGSSLGFLVALLTTRFRALERGLTPLAVVVAATPILVVAPIANIWFGLLNPFAKISVVAVVTFFPVYLHAARGLNSVPTNHLELMHSLGSSRLHTLFRLRIPASLPLLFVGLKIAASLSMITTVVSEYFGGSRRALGVYISQQASLVRFDAAWAGIVIACSLALLLYGAVLLIERLVAPWQPQTQNQRK